MDARHDLAFQEPAVGEVRYRAYDLLGRIDSPLRSPFQKIVAYQVELLREDPGVFLFDVLLGIAFLVKDCESEIEARECHAGVVGGKAGPDLSEAALCSQSIR